MGEKIKDLEKKIFRIVADKLDINDVKKIKSELNLKDDLGMDSFAAVEITFGLKDEFGIDIPQGDLKKIKKVKDIIDYISEHV